MLVACCCLALLTRACAGVCVLVTVYGGEDGLVVMIVNLVGNVRVSKVGHATLQPGIQ